MMSRLFLIFLMLSTFSSKAQLFDAVKARNSSKVKTLLSQGADPNIRGYGRPIHDNDGEVKDSEKNWTPLMVASDQNDLESVKALVIAGAKVTAANEIGYTALHYATQNGYSDLAIYLLQHSAAHYDTAVVPSGWLLYNAISYHLQDLANALIDSGENVNYISAETGRSCLIEGFYDRLPQVGKRIANMGADVNTPGQKYKDRALSWAARYNYLDAVKLLLEKGAKVNATDDSYYTALAFAASNQFDDTAIVKLLIAKGAIINPKDRKGRTALIEAAGSKNYNVCKMLLASGADPNQQAEHFGYISPLRQAVFWNDNRISQLLVDNGADVNLKTDNGSSILLEAVGQERNLGLVKMLIAKGARVNDANDDGETPLLKTISYNNPAMMKLLMQHGADLNAVDSYGRNAIMLAEKGGDAAMIALVKSYLKH